MSKSKQTQVKVGQTTTNNTDDCAETAVYLVDEAGKHIGVATLKSKPGLGIHRRFENAVKMMVKEHKITL